MTPTGLKVLRKAQEWITVTKQRYNELQEAQENWIGDQLGVLLLIREQFEELSLDRVQSLEQVVGNIASWPQPP